MTVRVDPIMVWPTKLLIFRNGSSHLTADTEEELHAFAARLGLKREWYQNHPIMPHYDLTRSKFDVAVWLGAVIVPMREQIRIARAKRPIS